MVMTMMTMTFMMQALQRYAANIEEGEPPKGSKDNKLFVIDVHTRITRIQTQISAGTEIVPSKEGLFEPAYTST
jgi:hypothetical protein